MAIIFRFDHMAGENRELTLKFVIIKYNLWVSAIFFLRKTSKTAEKYTGV